MCCYQEDFRGRAELRDKYGHNALLLYALELRYELEDIFATAGESLTDGGNDKKCDLLYLDRDAGLAVIAQGYMRECPKDRDLAPANKASDLNTAAAWLFSRDLDEIPEQIRDNAKGLQEAIRAGEISALHFWYVHNLNERNNPEVRKELDTVELAARCLLEKLAPEHSISVQATEVGNRQIEKWFQSRTKRIVIEDELLVDCVDEGIEERGDNWRSYTTSVRGTWLKQLLERYPEDDLFSRNPRNFLGAGANQNKINLGIRGTVQEEPENFYVYNNGITALVYQYDKNSRPMSIRGITIINGAQTTGVLGSADCVLPDLKVSMRFIVCSDPKIIDKIISNNNKQNVILPSDLRSNEKQQERLRGEFLNYPALYYSGGRRSSTRPRGKEVFDPYMVAQTLLAFHGDPVVAYNGRKTIWDEDPLYNHVFADRTTAEHCILVYALARAIDGYKARLNAKGEERTEIELEQSYFLSRRGSKMLLIYAVGASMESLAGRKIRDLWGLTFRNNQDFSALVALWESAVVPLLSFTGKLLPALNEGLKSKELVAQATKDFTSMVSAVQLLLQRQLSAFLQQLNIASL